jgi:RNA polymerase sigma-70 factor (ECF subfamily)
MHPGAGTGPLEALSGTRSRLRAFVSRRVPAGTDAEDIVQDVLLRLLERADDVSPAKVDAWASTAARNAIVDQVRRRRPLGLEDEAAIESVNDATPDADLADLAGCLRPMLELLDEEDRRLVERVDAGGASQADVARELGAPLSTVKSRVQRARQRLRAIIERCCEVELDPRGNPIDARRRQPGSCSGDCDRTPARGRRTELFDGGRRDEDYASPAPSTRNSSSPRPVRKAAFTDGPNDRAS